MLFDLQGDEAQNVFVDAHLAFHLGQGGRGGVDVEQREVRLAVLLDPVGEGLDAPVFDLFDLAAGGGDDPFILLGQRFHLLGGYVLTSKIDVLVKSHDDLAFLCVRLLRRGALRARRKARRNSKSKAGTREDEPRRFLLARPAFRSAPGRSRRSASYTRKSGPDKAT